MTVEQQARALAAMVACGAALGAACDVLGLLRRALRAGRVLTGAIDLLWGVLAALSVVLVGLRLQIDLLRAYVLAGVLAGMGVYALLIGLPGRRLAQAIQGRMKKRAVPAPASDPLCILHSFSFEADGDTISYRLKKDEKEEKEKKKGRKMAN